MKGLSVFVMGAALMLATSLNASAATKIVRVSDREPVQFSQFLDDVSRADVLFIGDTHDDRQLHASQLEIVQALYARNPQLAIGLEMFTSDYQRQLDDWTQGRLSEKEFTLIYAKNWSYDWSLSRDLFVFARDNHIPMLALNVPKLIISKVVRMGAKSLSESERQGLPPGVSWSLSPRQTEYLRRIREQVFGNKPSPIPLANFDEAQALRNRSMALGVARFREKSPKTKVAVIAGTWHAIRNGAPESLKEYGGGSCKVVLPDLPEFSWLKPSAEDVDYLVSKGK